MKIKESYWHEASKADKNDKPNGARDANRRHSVDQTDAPHKLRQTESPSKDETKFASLLESSAKPAKLGQNRDDSGEERGEDRKKEKKQAGREKDSAENLRDGKPEKFESFGGNAGGGGGAQSGYGMGAGVNQLSLNENFAARSILHIADLERLISTIRTQVALNGRREIVLQLKRSVLEGLRVKIVTDPSTRVQIEFLAANEKVRSEIEKHSPELADILRGRGINLETLKTTIENPDQGGGDEASTGGKLGEISNSSSFSPASTPVDDQSDAVGGNTFADVDETGGKIYNA